MKTKRQRSFRLAFSILCIAIALVFSGSAAAQLPRPADPRMDDINKLRDYNRILDGQQKDKAAQLKKEERIAVVNEAFKRLQLLHNEMMTILTSQTTVEDAKLRVIGEEVKLRAMELNANLALPKLPAERESTSAQPSATITGAIVTEHLSSICSQIREFVKNVNLSPTEPKAGVQARRDLVSLIEKSDALILLVTPAGKS